MISWRISICCGERSFPCWLGAKSSSRSLTNVFFCSSVNPERDSSSSAIWCFWYGSTPVESLRQCHRSVSTVWKRRQDDSCYGNCTASLFHFHPKHIKARSDSERFYSNNKARTAIAWFWACQYTSNPWKISWRTYHVLWEWMFQFTADIPFTPISWQKSPFRYIIVEISSQNVYSFIQENLPDEDYSNAQFFNAVNAKMSVDGVDWQILFWMAII